jgi:Protein of unknown function (DUF3667)
MPRRKVRRKTHICPNCETVLEREENYCHVCGQENHNLNVPMKDLVMEVIGSFTFFETKFIETAKIIFTHPGKLTLDFNSGKRAKYMHPVRMYFWVSAILFSSIIFSASKDDKTSKNKVSETSKTNESFENGRPFGRTIMGKDSEAKDDLSKKEAGIGKSNKQNAEIKQSIVKNSTNKKYSESNKKEEDKVWIGMFNKFQISKDSVEYYYKLSEDELDSILTKKGISTFYSNKRHISNDLQKRYDELLQTKYGIDNTENRSVKIFEMMPNLIFIMLPFAALILWMFERHTKWKFYFQHLVFTLNTHSAIFLMWSIFIIFSRIFEDLLGLKILEEISSSFAIIILFLSFLYFFISLKKVYLQSWLKTTLKFFLLTLSYGVTFFLLFLIGVLSGLIQM